MTSAAMPSRRRASRAESYEPALDALRRLGIAADVIPFIPPRGEEVLPFYP